MLGIIVYLYTQSTYLFNPITYNKTPVTHLSFNWYQKPMKYTMEDKNNNTVIFQNNKDVKLIYNELDKEKIINLKI